jgi:DNA polymerase/3'-5' exonuclease PolX
LSDKPKLPLSVARPLAEELSILLQPACLRIAVAGSIRRLRPEVSDIELVAVPKIETVEEVDGDLFGAKATREWNLLFEALDRFIPSYIKSGPKYRAFYWPVRRDGETTGHVQVDLFTATPENYGLILAIRTGSAGFSKQLVTALRARGLCSSEGRVYHLVNNEPAGDPVSTPSELDVFRLAGMKWIAPAERNYEL